jgi:ABC-2 type transport system permease protein
VVPAPDGDGRAGRGVSGFPAALYGELLKARRSRVPLVTVLGFSLAPIAAGVFLFILQNPQRARAWGLLGAKAQLTLGAADWPTLIGFLSQATAVGGLVVFAFVAAWVFGREFPDRTVRQLLALPTSRSAIVAAKLTVVGLWCALLTAWIFGLGLAVGTLLGLPGGSPALLRQAIGNLAGTALLTIALQSGAAFLASAGRGYLAPLGFALLTVFLAQILAALGFGGLFPWSVPALYSGVAGPRAGLVGAGGFLAVALTSLAGLVATFLWWRRADQTS